MAKERSYRWNPKWYVLTISKSAPPSGIWAGPFGMQISSGSCTCAVTNIWQVDLTNCHLLSDLKRGQRRGWQVNMTSAICQVTRQVPLIPKTQVVVVAVVSLLILSVGPWISFIFRPNCWRYKALSGYFGLQTFKKFFWHTDFITYHSNPPEFKFVQDFSFPLGHPNSTTFSICQHYKISEKNVWCFFQVTTGPEKWNYEASVCDKPDIHDASVRWLVASEVLGDGSTKPRFRNAKLLITRISILHHKLLAVRYISRL